LDYLRWRGIPCYKHQNASIYRDGRYIFSYTRGVSDIIGCIPKTGRYSAIEVKRPGGKPTPEQRQFIDTINEAGGRSLWRGVWKRLSAILNFIMPGDMIRTR
jgi:hypothetical protein